MNVFQVYISEGNQPMGSVLGSYVESVRQNFNHLEHVLLDGGQIEGFLKENFNDDVISSYQMLKPFAYKADLARLCLLKVIGGWYVDLGFRAVIPIGEVHENIGLIALRDTVRYSEVSWACANNLIYAKPQHPAICRAIEIIVENCKNEYYGINQLSPTGPYVLGQAIAEKGPNNQTIFGDFLELTPNHLNKNRAAVLPDGTIIAMYKPSMKQGLRQDLKDVGAEGTNDYEAMWMNRDVYQNSKEVFS
jgi:mannosyltransferase OCH1-like enzyme